MAPGPHSPTNHAAYYQGKEKQPVSGGVGEWFQQHLGLRCHPLGQLTTWQAWRGTSLPVCEQCGKQLCRQGQDGKLTSTKASLESRFLKKVEKPQQAPCASWNCHSATVQAQAKPAGTKAPC